MQHYKQVFECLKHLIANRQNKANISFFLCLYVDLVSVDHIDLRWSGPFEALWVCETMLISKFTYQSAVGQTSFIDKFNALLRLMWWNIPWSDNPCTVYSVVAVLLKISGSAHFLNWGLTMNYLTLQNAFITWWMKLQISWERIVSTLLTPNSA